MLILNFQALLDEAFSHQKIMAKLNAISSEIIELSKVHFCVCGRSNIIIIFCMLLARFQL